MHPSSHLSADPGAARLPTNHRLVHEIVSDLAPGVHATVGEVFARARARRPRIGFSTVYRALARLRDLGLVAEVRVPGRGPAVYEPARPGHAHFLCDRCGEVDDVDYALPPAVLDEIARRCGQDVAGAFLTLHGTCARCAASPDAA
jgi:Fe2+ or Zn2+ uptake regulation protein